MNTASLGARFPCSQKLYILLQLNIGHTFLFRAPISKRGPLFHFIGQFHNSTYEDGLLQYRQIPFTSTGTTPQPTSTTLQRSHRPTCPHFRRLDHNFSTSTHTSPHLSPCESFEILSLPITLAYSTCPRPLLSMTRASRYNHSHEDCTNCSVRQKKEFVFCCVNMDIIPANAWIRSFLNNDGTTLVSYRYLSDFVVKKLPLSLRPPVTLKKNALKKQIYERGGYWFYLPRHNRLENLVEHWRQFA